VPHAFSGAGKLNFHVHTKVSNVNASAMIAAISAVYQTSSFGNTRLALVTDTGVMDILYGMASTLLVGETGVGKTTFLEQCFIGPTSDLRKTVETHGLRSETIDGREEVGRDWLQHEGRRQHWTCSPSSPGCCASEVRANRSRTTL
jgi:hypothetical protein